MNENDRTFTVLDPLVSIIIPTYNRKGLLAEAVQSCLDQTYQNIEIIIVDDGSTDGTDKFIAEQLATQWVGREVRYIRQANAGASAARNKGLHLAQGDFIQFLDSDDLLNSEKLFIQTDCLMRADPPAEGCSCYGRYRGVTDPLSSGYRIGVKCDCPLEYLRRMGSREVHVMQTGAVLWRSSFLKKHEGWRTDIDLGDDLEYYMRMLADARRIVFVEQELFTVRESAGPRLSDAYKNRDRTLSAIRTQRSVVEILRHAKIWDASSQMSVLRTQRTIYANLLEVGTGADIKAYEA